MRYGIACYPVNSGGRVNLVNAESLTQGTRRQLSGSSLFTWIYSGKSKLAAGARTKHAADDSLLTHAQANHGMRVAVFLQELHHHHVVIKRVGSGHDLDEVRGILLHLGKDFFQLFGADSHGRKESGWRIGATG